MPTEEKSCKNCGYNGSDNKYVAMCHNILTPCIDNCQWIPTSKGLEAMIKQNYIEKERNEIKKERNEAELQRVNDYLSRIDLAKEGEDKTVMSNILDSGNRTQFQTGAVRDMHQGKGRCDLLPPNALLRLARHFETGSLKYGDRNWELGIPCHSFADSGMRHLLKYMAGNTDEDHLIAAIWNLMCLAETEELRPEMQDIPSREPIDQLRGMDMDGDLEALGTPQEEMARLQKIWNEIWNEGKDRYNEK